ncbi:MAG: MerR family transcriptional regulator, aldehyde-responsive regulator [Carnobacterium sp.]|uniref:MerR family transcriptional regulator n=1 Tax=Carnobacterium inhibens TaxID=147709 RepID=A0ABR7TAV8_9LACT|nr:MerR family transcriptional regulator [Carnobacterium inhibens]MDN5372419.1 MerR family transcriptional regulator, aldehyde-responsive regulator [Carnobacterium sp.]
MLFLKINEVTKKYGVSPATLRYYEEINLLPEIARVSGSRWYCEQDLKRLEFIFCMKDSNMSLEKIKDYFNLIDQGDTTLQARLDLLLQHKEETANLMRRIQSSLDYIDYKIELTESSIVQLS